MVLDAPDRSLVFLIVVIITSVTADQTKERESFVSMNLRQTQSLNWWVVIPLLEMFFLMGDQYGRGRHDLDLSLNCFNSDFGWGDYDAKVICRMLGLDTLVAKATLRSKFGDVGRDYIIAYVACRGSEEHIGQCYQGPGTMCGNGRGAGVMCIPPGPTSNIPVELVGGSDNTEGAVKIYGQPIQ